jgi:hypothetical protein
MTWSKGQRAIWYTHDLYSSVCELPERDSDPSRRASVTVGWYQSDTVSSALEEGPTKSAGDHGEDVLWFYVEEDPICSVISLLNTQVRMSCHMSFVIGRDTYNVTGVC